MKEVFYKNGLMASSMESNVLLYLTKSFIKHVISNDPEALDCFRRILDSRKRGLLLLAYDSSSYEKIKLFFEENKYEELLQIIRTHEKNIRRKKQLIKSLKVITFVTAIVDKPIRKDKFIFVSYKFINQTNLLYPPIFLAENLTDCSLYAEKIANNAGGLVDESLSIMKLSDRFEPGGGNSIHASLSRHNKKFNDFCLCIVDSDRRCPDEGFGDTAKFAIEANDLHGSPFSELVVIDTYSAENLLPLPILKSEFSLGKSEKEIEKFNLIEKIRKNESWKHIPLKKGVKGKDFKSGDEAWKGFWRQTLERLEVDTNCCIEEKCNCVIVPSFSDKTLSVSVGDKYADWETFVNKEENIYVIEEYKKISEIVRAWLCVGSPIRS